MIETYVVIPAHDEEDQIGGCLCALAAQTVGRDAFGIVLALDACTDATEATASRVARALGLHLEIVQSAQRGAGAARRTGMQHAASRLLTPDGLIATTDADSRPAPTWLATQLALVRDGAQAIAGLIELDAPLSKQVQARRDRAAADRLSRVRDGDPVAAHHHFAGASLAVTAGTYRAVGGIEPLAALEDEAFAQRLLDHAIPIVRSGDVRVRTSARRVGRASRGLAVDLDVANWLETRRHARGAFTIADLIEAKGEATVAVVLPTREVAGTIAGVLTETVGPLVDAGLIDELIVVDADSRDGTEAVARATGARVLQQDAILDGFGPALGKGDAMWRAVNATSADIVAFLDADTADPGCEHLVGLLGPLLTDPEVMLVKGAFDRPFAVADGELAHEGGRVTEMMARPLLNLHAPRLAGLRQPLAGETAARRALLESIPFPAGYGVEISMLLDTLNRHGLAAIAEADLGTRRNRHQSLRALGEMAYAVLVAVERRVREDEIRPGRYLRPWEDARMVDVPVLERPPLATLQDGPGEPASPGCHNRRGHD